MLRFKFSKYKNFFLPAIYNRFETSVSFMRTGCQVHSGRGETLQH